MKRAFFTLNVASLLFAGAALLHCPHALAERSVTFSASGQNYTGGLAKSSSYSNCQVTVVNNSNTDQSVSFSISLSASATNASYNLGTVTLSHTVTLKASTYTPQGANCDNSSSSCTFPDSGTLGDVVYSGGLDYPTLPSPGSAITQDVFCSGTITVNDSTPGTPGFITASGVLNTYRESIPGVSLTNATGTSKVVTTSPSTSVIVIGEGKPF